MKFVVADIRTAKDMSREMIISADTIFNAPVDLASFQKPIHVVARAQMTHADIYVSAEVKTSVRCICVRCLESVEQKLELGFSQTFDPDQTVIDLTDDIRETIVVNLDTKPLCQKDCQGLCPTCGQNRNVEMCDCQILSEGPLGRAMKLIKTKKIV